MRNIPDLIQELIPQNNYQSRNGFSNEHIVLSLSEKEKVEVERRLIEMLDETDDDLIGETLAIMNSTDSLPNMRKRLESAKNPSQKIIWANYINEIKGGDQEMKDIALQEMDRVTEKYSLTSIFYYLSRFMDSRINEKIRSFTNDKDYLIAYNARTSLGIDTADLIKR